MTKSVDIVTNSISLIGPDGTLQTFSGSANGIGVKGDKGDQGIQGIQGIQGTQGIQGLKGDQGIQGLQGLKGDQGIQGLKGDQGLQGLQGLKGDQGIQGLKGDTGSQGIQGLKGDQGIQGLKGDQGIQGIQGPAGSISNADLNTVRKKTTNLKNIINTITAPDSSYISNFDPTDTILWDRSSFTELGANYTNGADTITNEWGVVEHYAQMLTFPNPSIIVLHSYFDLQYSFQNDYAGVY